MAQQVQDQAKAAAGMGGWLRHYRRGTDNHCPDCGGAQWLVGRKLAECAVCATALPIGRLACGNGA